MAAEPNGSPPITWSEGCARPEKRPVAGSYQHGNKTSVSINGGEFLVFPFSQDNPPSRFFSDFPYFETNSSARQKFGC
jgi:hypothetical protein